MWGFRPNVIGTLAALYLIDRDRNVHYRNALFWRFLVAPPRMLDGYVDTLQSFVASGIARPGTFTNQYEAVPSFHVSQHSARRDAG